MQLRLARADMPVQDVDLQVALPQHRREFDRLAVAPPHDRQAPGHELLRAERHGQDVVHATLERRQLGLEVAPTREGDDRKMADLLRGAEPLQDRAPRDVHVEDDEMGPPARERGGRFRHRAHRPRAVAPVIERELDDLGEDGLLDHQQGARRTAQPLVMRRHPRVRCASTGVSGDRRIPASPARWCRQS
jgi:hypothetical protein